MPGIYANSRENKMYPLHQDTHGWYPDRGKMLQTLKDVQEQDLAEVEAAFPNHRFIGELKVPRPYRRHKALWHDPVVLYAVVQALIDTQRGIYIRPGYLINFLNENWPLYYWSAAAIGRIISGLNSACESEYNPMGHKEKMTRLPLSKGRDSKGNYYVIDPVGGNEGLLWLSKVRNILVDKIHEVMGLEAQGIFDDSPLMNTSPNQHYPEILEGSSVRSPANYESQMRPGETFGVSTERLKVTQRDPLAV